MYDTVLCVNKDTDWSESLNMKKTNLKTNHDKGKVSSFPKLYLSLNIIIEY